MAGKKAAKKVPAKKVAAKKTPAKKVPAKKVPAKKVPAKKAPASVHLVFSIEKETFTAEDLKAALTDDHIQKMTEALSASKESVTFTGCKKWPGKPPTCD